MKWIFSLVFAFSLTASADTAALPSSEESLVPQTSLATVSEAVQESQIPVVLEGAKKSVVNENPFLKIMITFGILGVLGCAAYFLIKKYLRPGNSPSQANQVKILSQHYLGPKKSLAIIRVAGESILIGITDHNISLIKGLSLLDEEIPDGTPKTFKSIFNAGARTETTANPSPAAKDEDGLDEFSISGIKDFVATKLKTMRTLE